MSKELLNAKSANEAYEAQISGLQSQMNENMRNMDSESFLRYNELLSKTLISSKHDDIEEERISLTFFSSL